VTVLSHTATSAAPGKTLLVHAVATFKFVVLFARTMSAAKTEADDKATKARATDSDVMRELVFIVVLASRLLFLTIKQPSVKKRRA
jgi:hypothetical protein